MFQRAQKLSDALPAGSVTERVSVASRSSPWPDHHCLVPPCGAPSWVVTTFLGSGMTTPWALAVLYSLGPRLSVRAWPAGTTS